MIGTEWRRGRPLKGAVAVSQLPQLLDYWNVANASDRGIRIASERPNALLQKLYMARRECGHNAYNGLRLVERPDAVWILKRE